MERRKVLVTGGTRGVGKATVLAYANTGYDVGDAGRTANPGRMLEVDEDGCRTVIPGSLGEAPGLVEALGLGCGADPDGPS